VVESESSSPAVEASSTAVVEESAPNEDDDEAPDASLKASLSVAVPTALAIEKTTSFGGEDLIKYASFARAGEAVICTALVNKPNPVGIKLMRQLILTNARLIWVDASRNVLKGEIDVIPGKGIKAERVRFT
jgi:hypothetical protein